MLLSIRTLGLLALLFLAQSGAALEPLKCIALGTRMTGFCLRPVDSKWDTGNPAVHPNTKYLAVPAANQGPITLRGTTVYSCNGLLIFGHPPDHQYCCDYKPRPKDGFGMTDGDLHNHCTILN